MDHMDHMDRMDRMVHMDIWIFGYWYIYIYVYNTYQPLAAVSQLPAALRLPPKNTPLDLFNTYIVICVHVHEFESPWLNK